MIWYNAECYITKKSSLDQRNWTITSYHQKRINYNFSLFQFPCFPYKQSRLASQLSPTTMFIFKRHEILSSCVLAKRHKKKIIYMGSQWHYLDVQIVFLYFARAMGIPIRGHRKNLCSRRVVAKFIREDTLCDIIQWVFGYSCHIPRADTRAQESNNDWYCVDTRDTRWN